MKSAKLITLPLVAMLVASCAAPTDPAAGQQTAAAQIAVPQAWSAGQQSAQRPIRWLESFNDPALVGLIKEGQTNNLDLHAAAGSMEKAWLLAEQSGAALKPTADLSLGATSAGSAGGAASNSLSVGLTVSWEADVWGRLSAGVSAAQASAEAAAADYRFARHSLSANIAKSYLKVIEAKQQTQITRQNLEVLEEITRITRARYDNGAASPQDLALSRANVAAAQEQLIVLEGAQRDAARGLEVLLGRYPDATLDIPDALPELPAPPPAGLPSAVLERRPDLVSAERGVAAAFNATDAAQAARLPRFSLTSSASGASGSLAGVLNPSNIAWQLGTSLLAPLFDGGRRELDVQIATVEQQQAVAAYAQSALNAFAEVETNLDQGQVLARRAVSLAEVREQSDEAFRIAELRYKEGEVGLLDTLQIRQQAIAAASSQLALSRLQLEQRINLYLALGGDW